MWLAPCTSASVLQHYPECLLNVCRLPLEGSSILDSPLLSQAPVCNCVIHEQDCCSYSIFRLQSSCLDKAPVTI